MRVHTEAEQVLLQRGVGGEGGHAALMRHLAVVHHRDGVAELAGEGEVLFDHQQGRLFRLQQVPSMELAYFLRDVYARPEQRPGSGDAGQLPRSLV